MSIRTRLTLLYGFILGATLAVFCVLLYGTLAYATRDVMEDTLALEMQRLKSTDVQSPALVRWPAQSLGGGETYWQSCDSRGEVVDRTDNLQEHQLPLSTMGLQQIQAGEPIFETAEIDEVPLLIHSQSIMVAGQVTGILQVARSMAEQEQALSLLRTALGGGSIVTLVLAIGIGWLISGAALRPIDQLTRTAQLIGAERSFERRVQYTGPPDEVGRLATTFNVMLAALQTAYQQTAQALQAQRWFVTDASHELRTPLTTLRGNLALLRREPPIPEADRQAVLADIVDENERMIRLVHDLLTLARADSATGFEAESVALPPLFTELERLAAGLHPGRALDIAVPAGAAAVGRRDLLKQVLLILLDNAFKFTPADGQVRLSAEQVGGAVRVQVADTGMGIAEADLPRIFQRFYRGDHARSGSGYGLGLAIARTLVEKQGGAIVVESEVGRGSTFTITLPAAPSPEVADGRHPQTDIPHPQPLSLKERGIG